MEKLGSFDDMCGEGKAFPRQFGPYVLKQKIASGGMAELFLAEVTGPGGFILHASYNIEPGQMVSSSF